jgi:hypothetical protein
MPGRPTQPAQLAMLTGTPADLPAMADVVIVGSGAVGLTVANRLIAKGRKVVIIEAGRQAIDHEFRSHNAGLISGRAYKGLSEGRYRGLGGTTRLWGGQLMRLSDGQLEPSAALGKPGWLVSRKELARFEDEALRLLGMGNSVAEAAKAWSSKARISPLLGLDLELALSFWMPKPDFSRLFADQLKAPNGPAVLLEHEVTGLVCEPANGRVTGVAVRGPDGSSEVFGREIVLAGGTLENLRLLLRAKAALPGSPLAENRNVGRWFIDHLHGNFGSLRTHDAAMMGRFFDTHYGLAGLKVSTKLRLSERLMAKQPMAACAVTVTGPVSLGEAMREMAGLLQRLAPSQRDGGGSLFELGSRLRLFAPLVWNFLRFQRSGTFLSGRANFGLEVEQLPCADSYVALEPGVPPEQARLDVHWQLDGREIEAVTEMCQRFKRWCDATGYAALEYDPQIDQRDPAVLDRFHDSSHHMGGARMASSAADGVVDADLAVFGMPGLSVAGAAVFPSGGFANPTLSAMALGLRLADRLAQSAGQ